MFEARIARSPRSCRVIPLVLTLLLGAVTRAQALDSGYVQGGNGAGALAILKSVHGRGATLTEYTSAQLAGITDFSVHDDWYVPASYFPLPSRGSPLESNPVFQQGDAFGRVLVTGMDPGAHLVGGDPDAGPSTMLSNALRWAGAGGKPGLVVEADP